MAEDEDRSKPVSIADIIVENKNRAPAPGRIPMPVSVGNSGGWGDKAMSQERTYHDEDDDVPNGGVIGARISNTRR
jgi:hypothetical protein